MLKRPELTRQWFDNGDFEMWDGTDLFGWVLEPGTGTITKNTNAAYFTSGTSSVGLARTSTGVMRIYQTRRDDTLQGKWMRLRFAAIASENVTDGLAINVYDYLPSKQVYQADGETLWAGDKTSRTKTWDATTSFQWFEFLFKIATDGGQIEVLLYNQEVGSPATWELYLDAFSLIGPIYP